jgi:hypothetical protein
MEFKGTKGKWEVGTVNNGQQGINGLVIWSPEYSQKSDGTYEMVCHITQPDEQTETDEPNALLISKAPEMLEMLKDIIRQANEVVYVNSMGASETYFQLIEQAENLIKEATEI